MRDSDNKLRLGLLGLQGTDNENHIKSKKYFQAQMQLDQTLTRGYMARRSLQRSSLIVEV